MGSPISLIASGMTFLTPFGRQVILSSPSLTRVSSTMAVMPSGTAYFFVAPVVFEHHRPKYYKVVVLTVLVPLGIVKIVHIEQCAIVGDVYHRKVFAVLKCTKLDLFNAFGDSQLLEPCAALEGVSGDSGHAVGDNTLSANGVVKACESIVRHCKDIFIFTMKFVYVHN